MNCVEAVPGVHGALVPGVHQVYLVDWCKIANYSQSKYTPNGDVIKTSKELQMLFTVTPNCWVTKILMNSSR